ncbi:MAG: hypothetical protein WBF58_22815 [Xanthobacteraceae bacterium]
MALLAKPKRQGAGQRATPCGAAADCFFSKLRLGAARAQFSKARLRASRCRKKQAAVKPARYGFFHQRLYRLEHALEFFCS